MQPLTVSSDETPSPNHPVEIPDYHLLSKIGIGGFGEVYVARNRHDGEFCALKILFQNQSAVELDAVRHYKNIVKDSQFLVQIQHVGKADTGVYYYVMALADDANGPAVLRAPDQYKPLTLQLYRAARGPLALDEALGIADCLLLALKQLHGNRLVHCDVKPANVLRVGGKWRLGDIGLLTPRELLKVRRGTRWFLPPDDQADFKTDVYALGKTLLLLVTECKPPDNDKAPDPLNDFVCGKLEIPGDDERKERVRQIILGACNKNPLDRSSIKSLHEVVAKLLQKTTIVLNVVGVDFDSLDEDQLVRELATRLGLSILSSRKKRGSVLLELELTPVQAEYLLMVANSGELTDLNITEAWEQQTEQYLEKQHQIEHSSQDIDVELISAPTVRKKRWVPWLLPVISAAAAFFIIIWLGNGRSAMDWELAFAKEKWKISEQELNTTKAKLRESDRKLELSKKVNVRLVMELSKLELGKDDLAKLEKKLLDKDWELESAKELIVNLKSKWQLAVAELNAAKKNAGRSLNGRIALIAVADNTKLTILTNGSGKGFPTKFDFTLKPDVKIFIDDKLARASDLKQGMSVRLNFDRMQTLLSIEAKTKR